MKHERITLASHEGFGSVSSCSCGNYHIHLAGVSIHLNEEKFNNLLQMVLQANAKYEQLSSKKVQKDYLQIVK
jgi:hypothetical protein